MDGKILRLCHGDLTQEKVDAIVNAANANLVHGGGVAAAIVARGGPSIQEQSNRWVAEHGPATHAQPAITDSGKLPSKYVIHAVGPVWGEGDEDHKLKTAVFSSLQLAESHHCESVALPAISTGIFGFPKARGARQILDAILEFFQETQISSLELVSITLIDQPTVDIFLEEFVARWGETSIMDSS